MKGGRHDRMQIHYSPRSRGDFRSQHQYDTELPAEEPLFQRKKDWETVTD